MQLSLNTKYMARINHTEFGHFWRNTENVIELFLELFRSSKSTMYETMFITSIFQGNNYI